MISVLSVTQFIAFLTFAVVFFDPETDDPVNRPVETPEFLVKKEYDFVIVGAGTAGSTVANRLSEVSEWNVLLIEAGEDENVITDTPAMSVWLRGTNYDWNFTTVEQKYLCRDVGGFCSYPRGRAMGGSSAINAMMYVRGDRRDFDGWEGQGNPGWSWDSMLKYFVKLENVSLHQHLLNGTEADRNLRGTEGPLTIQYSRFFLNISQAVVRAANQLGYILGDYNGVTQKRVGFVQSTMNGGSRESASKAYLNPINERKNLDVIKNSLVTRLIFDDSDAVVGVEYIQKEKINQVYASKEVILSTGAINTPKILLLSGVGPEDHLKALNIPVRKNLPVGKNLQDHPFITLRIATDEPAQFSQQILFSSQSVIEFAKHREGPLTSTRFDLVAFKAFLNESQPNGQWTVFSTPSANNVTETFSLTSSLLKPHSRGTVRLQSSDPTADPLIDPNYLAEERDRNVLREIVRETLRILNTPALREIGARIDPKSNNLCADFISSGDEVRFIDCVIANQSVPYYNPVGTARMGPLTDKEAVVSSNLLVHGLRNLRIIDSSIMPNITGGNTNAPTFALAEKGADLVKETYLSSL